MREKLNLEYLSEKLAYANTPMYLYKSYQEEDSLKQLNTYFSEDELIERFEYLISSKFLDFSELVEIYSIIIALNFKVGKKVEAFFEKQLHSSFKWISNIASYYFSKNSTTTEEMSFDIKEQNKKNTNDLQITID